jgi:hypothetical protein
MHGPGESLLSQFTLAHLPSIAIMSSDGPSICHGITTESPRAGVRYFEGVDFEAKTWASQEMYLIIRRLLRLRAIECEG